MCPWRIDAGTIENRGSAGRSGVRDGMTDLLDAGQLLVVRQAFSFVWVIVFAGAFLAFAGRLSSIRLQEKLPAKTFTPFPDRRQCRAAMTFCAGKAFVYAWGWLYLFMQSTGGDMTVVNDLYVLAISGHVIAMAGCIWCIRAFVPDSLPTAQWVLIVVLGLAGLVAINLVL
jgi:hypothetical protein